MSNLIYILPSLILFLYFPITAKGQITGAYLVPKEALSEFAPLNGSLFRGDYSNSPGRWVQAKDGKLINENFSPGYYAVYQCKLLSYFFGPYQELSSCSQAVATLKGLQSHPALINYEINVGMIFLHPDGVPLESLSLKDGTLVLLNLFERFIDSNSGQYSMGVDLNQKKYGKVPVVAPLDSRLNPIPDSVTLLGLAPPRLSQGSQGSCVGWAVAYGAISTIYHETYGQEMPFSPSFLFNHIGKPDCNGSHTSEAMEFIKNQGSLPLNEFPYFEQTCSRKATESEFMRAGEFRIKDFQRLSVGAGNYKVDLEAIRQHISANIPVVIAMKVPETFKRKMNHQRLWIPNDTERSIDVYGNHAICVIGYNNNYQGGAFQIMNSWGSEWGEDGIAWIRYVDFGKYVREAYAIYYSNLGNNKLEAQIALVNPEKNPLPLSASSNTSYGIEEADNLNKEFQIKFSNQADCFIYIFGSNGNGRTKVIFPYDASNSSYLGLTGTRIFPRDFPLTSEENEQLAIVVSRHELDYQSINKKLGTLSGSLEEKINKVFNRRVKVGVSSQAGQISLSGDMNAHNEVTAIVISTQ